MTFKRRALNTLAVGAAVAALAGLSVPSAQAAASSQLTRPGTGKCLAIGNSSTANGAKVIQWTCIPTSSGQHWSIS